MDACVGGLPVVSHVAFQAAFHDAFQVWDIYHHISSLGIARVFARPSLYVSVEKCWDIDVSDCGAGLGPQLPDFVGHHFGRVAVLGPLSCGSFWQVEFRCLPAPGPHLVGPEFPEPSRPVQVLCLGLGVFSSPR